MSSQGGWWVVDNLDQLLDLGAKWGFELGAVLHEDQQTAPVAG